MTQLEKKVIALLKDDARRSYSEIATLLGVEENQIKTIVTDLEKQGIIVKYSAIINTEKTGEDYVDALIEVKCTPQARSGFDAIAKEIYNGERNRQAL